MQQLPVAQALVGATVASSCECLSRLGETFTLSTSAILKLSGFQVLAIEFYE